MSLLFVALDSPKRERVLEWMGLLDDMERDFGYKVNLDFIVQNGGVGAIRDLPTTRPIFADMKMWNGVRTMVETCKALQDAGASFVSVYALAGVDMLTELREALSDLSHPIIKLLGLTVLTHYDDAYCREQFGMSLELTVSHLAEIAQNAGLHGIIVPGTALGAVKEFEIAKLVPAVRPLSYVEKRKDQKQTVSAQAATRAGADLLVCGSPVTKADDPRRALAEILEEVLAVAG